jgi:hypothetical protein
MANVRGLKLRLGKVEQKLNFAHKCVIIIGNDLTCEADWMRAEDQYLFENGMDRENCTFILVIDRFGESPGQPLKLLCDGHQYA